MQRLSRRAVLAGTAMLLASRPSYAASYREKLAIGVTAGQRAATRALAEAFLSTYSAPGLSVAYAKNGTLKYIAGFGQADQVTGEAMTHRSVFRIASISKPITAAAIMTLVEAGNLSLSQRIFGPTGILRSRFPLPADAPNKAWLKAITVNHLLTHTCGGWPNDGQDPMFQSIALDHDELILQTLSQQPLTSAPGTSYAYSNFGYCLLGRVIEVITGESYESYVRRVLLVPARTDMKIASNTLAERLPDEVRYLGVGFDPYSMNVRRMDSHGGWAATATELVRFGLRVDGYATVRDLIAKTSVTRMRTPSSVYPYYGRGWTISDRHNNRWHMGSLPGLVSTLVLVDGGDCFAGLVNTRRSSPDILSGLDQLMWDIFPNVMG